MHRAILNRPRPEAAKPVLPRIAAEVERTRRLMSRGLRRCLRGRPGVVARLAQVRAGHDRFQNPLGLLLLGFWRSGRWQGLPEETVPPGHCNLNP